MTMAHPKHDLEGGFLQVRKKLWKGVVRRKDDESIQWQCKHNHSRPEFNARYALDYLLDGEERYGVWEASALNCGRAAYRQWGEEVLVEGEIGAVGDPDTPVHLRPDIRFARVGKTTFSGKVELNDNGHRILSVKRVDVSGPSVRLNIDVSPKKGLTLPNLTPEDEQEALTALWLLKGGIWGVVFQDHKVNMHADRPLPQAIAELVPVETTAPPKGLSLPGKKAKPEPVVNMHDAREATGTARIEVATKNGRRMYEVVAPNGEVSGAFYQRGKAVEALERIR